jgi:hypothetical protein
MINPGILPLNVAGKFNLVAYGYRNYTTFNGSLPNGGTGIPTSVPLFVKITPSDPEETGLGIANPEDFFSSTNEIDNQHFIQLDLADFNRVRDTKCPDPCITISSVQQDEGFEILGSNILGTPGISLYHYVGTTTTESSYKLCPIPSFGTTRGDLINYGAVPPYRYISIRAFPIPSTTKTTKSEWAKSGGDVLLLNLSVYFCERQCTNQ